MNGKFFPATLTYLKTFKNYQNYQNYQNSQKSSKFSKILKILKILKTLKMSNYPRHLIFFFLLAPHVTVPVVLWAEACPFASSSTVSLPTTGLNVLCV